MNIYHERFNLKETNLGSVVNCLENIQRQTMRPAKDESFGIGSHLGSHLSVLIAIRIHESTSLRLLLRSADYFLHDCLRGLCCCRPYLAERQYQHYCALRTRLEQHLLTTARTSS